MEEFIISSLMSTVLVVLSTVIYYDVLRNIWRKLPHMKITPRKRIIVVMLAMFVGHTAVVWMYGLTYWLLSDFSNLGSLKGEIAGDFFGHLYYSAATYSSLGLGDIVPTGVLRMITGVEVLNGLLLIGWSVSFTYLAMQKFWDLH